MEANLNTKIVWPSFDQENMTSLLDIPGSGSLEPPAFTWPGIASQEVLNRKVS